MGNTFSLAGQVALVTGASSGFGAHFARVLARNGARVVIGARRVERLQRLADELDGEYGEVLGVPLDVTDRGSVIAAFEAAERRFGTVRIVINNAGVAEAGRVLEVSEDTWDFTQDTNLKGVWRVATEAARRMMRADADGSIINIASVLGLEPGVGHSAYSVSKAGVVMLTRSMALEMVRKNIRVNAICPGYFLTEMNQDYMASAAGQAYVRSLPSQRLGNLEELDGALLLLASSAGSYITGVTLPVDGGHLQRTL